MPSIVLEAKPLASGLFNQIGLPATGVMSARRQVPGLGAASAPDPGPASGRAVAPDSAPDPAAEQAAAFTVLAGRYPDRGWSRKSSRNTRARRCNGIQGTVVLEVIVTANGCASQIRIVRSLDPGGLDEEAVAAVAQWRFEPGRLGPRRSTCSSRSMVDFSIR